MKVKKMHIVNFGPFKDSEIEFNFTSALILGENPLISGASNGTGKSTIFQALVWVLTGDSRYKNSSAFIRDGQDSCKVTCWFGANGTDYEIIRGRNRANKATLDFNYLNDKGIYEPIKADTNSLLQAKIGSITKVTYDSFVNTNYFAQNSVSDFMYGTSSSRQALIAEILDMDRWNTYAKKADALLTEAEKDLIVVRAQIKEQDYEATKATLKQKQKELKETLASIDSVLKDKQTAQSTLVVQVAQEAALLAQKETQAFLQKEITDIQLGLADKKRLLLELNQKKSALEQKIQSLQASLVDIGAEPSVTEISDRLNLRVVERGTLEKRLLALKAGKCDTCSSEWKIGPNRTQHDHEAEIATLEKNLIDLDARIAKGKEAQATMIVSAKAWNAKKVEQFGIQKDLGFSKENLVKLEAEIPALEQKIKNGEALLVTKQSQVISVTAGTDSRSALAAIDKEIADSTRLILENRVALSKAGSDLEELEKQQANSAQKEIEKKDLETKINTYSALKKHFSKTGIQASILDSVVSEIQTLTNNFMSKLNYKPFTVEFVTQKLDTKGQAKETLDINIITPNSIKHIEDLSGGEQFRVAFSVRLALATVQARRLGSEMNLLLLDEVSSSLDKLGIETFVKIIKELEKSMTVMLITHDDSLKEHFDTVIKVSNTGSVAEIVQ